MTSPEVMKLAESLRQNGLAASVEDAVQKAENMLGVKIKGQDIRATKFDNPDFDISKEDKPLSEVMNEAEGEEEPSPTPEPNPSPEPEPEPAEPKPQPGPDPAPDPDRPSPEPTPSPEPVPSEEDIKVEEV